MAIHDAKMPKNRIELDALIARAEAHGGDRVRNMVGTRFQNTAAAFSAGMIGEELDRAVRILEGESYDYAESVRLHREWQKKGRA